MISVIDSTGANSSDPTSDSQNETSSVALGYNNQVFDGDLGKIGPPSNDINPLFAYFVHFPDNASFALAREFRENLRHV